MDEFIFNYLLSKVVLILTITRRKAVREEAFQRPKKAKNINNI